MNVKTSFLAITSRRKLNGEIPIYCDISNGTEKSRFGTNISTKLEAWDKKRQRVRGNSIEAIIINSSIDKIKEQIKNIVYEAIKRNEEITPLDVKNRMTGNNDSRPTSLMSVYKIRFENMKKLLGKDYQKTTLIKFNYLANSIQDFLKAEFKTNDIPLKKLNRVFIDDLELYLRAQRGMKTVSLNKITQMLKSIVRYSLERGWIEKDPFLGHKSKSVQTEILYLTHEQVIKLETTTLSQERLNRVKELFLFSIYTGLHYADAMSLTTSNLVKGIDDNLWIDYVRGKTDIYFCDTPKNDFQNGLYLHYHSMLKRVSILFLFLIGFTLYSNSTLACSKPNEKHKAKSFTFKVLQKDNDSCIKKHTMGVGHNCDEKCKHHNCDCTSINTTSFDFKQEITIEELFSFTIVKKYSIFTPLYYKAMNASIWHPPKTV